MNGDACEYACMLIGEAMMIRMRLESLWNWAQQDDDLDEISRIGRMIMRADRRIERRTKAAMEVYREKKD